MRTEQRGTFFSLFESLCCELVYLRRHALQMQDFLAHGAVDDPAGCQIVFRTVVEMTYQLARAVINIPPTEIEMFRIFVAD